MFKKFISLQALVTQRVCKVAHRFAKPNRTPEFVQPGLLSCDVPPQGTFRTAPWILSHRFPLAQLIGFMTESYIRQSRQGRKEHASAEN